MAVNQTSTNSNVCEKIYKAISHCPLSSKVNSSAPNGQKKVAGAAVSTEVPVNFNTPLSRAPLKGEGNTSVEKNGHLEKVASRNKPVKTGVAPSNGIAPTGITELEKPKPMVETIPLKKAVVGSGQGKGQQDFVKDEAVQLKGKEGNGNGTAGIAASGGGKSLSRRDTFNDRVSDFINTVKAKMRATSIGGGGRSVSIK
ncbi:hypothetical protein RHMOL_Rhmol13G0027200 [Rhododendron molle]|uniref:Uncharacterized protein n=1 Tax=Rhododendron molle TaxID=49168 RepID=A0ACC0L3L9_RHOML|nr:hypothetical protein RHMOL_Rhmol13G0027200 [Rhododendron molle]